MEKYSMKLVMDYINGEDITDYDLDILENDIQFMMMVIDASNDKNIYQLCGDDLRKNFDFIKYLVTKFRDDKDFIMMVGKEYMETACEKHKIEMKILICSYYNDIDSVDYAKFQFELELFYIRQRLACQNCIDELNEYHHGMVNSMGFDMLLDEYSDSNLIKDFFAKKMLEEIFNFSNVEFENIVHLKFKYKRKLCDVGINTFLIQFIHEKDLDLANYVTVHIDLIRDLYIMTLKILDNWEKYDLAKSREKIEIIFEEIDRFVSDNLYFVGSELEIFKYILCKFNLKKEFISSNVGLNYFDPEFSGNTDDIGSLNINNLNVEQYGNFDKFITRISSVCNFGIVPDDYLEEIPKREPAKILRLETKNSD